MSEVRYAQTYKDGVLIGKEPYEVSSEELEREAQEAKINELVAKSSRTSAENSQLIDLLASKLGYELPKEKVIKAKLGVDL